MLQKYFSLVAILFAASSASAGGICNDAQLFSSPATGAVSELSGKVNQTIGQVDLFSSDPQPLPKEVSKVIYQSISKKPFIQRCDLDTLICQVRLINFYCESETKSDSDTIYKCYYGTKGIIPDAQARPIYEALVKAGFVSDCDREPTRHCDVDPMQEISCKSTPTSDPKVQEYSCTIEI